MHSWISGNESRAGQYDGAVRMGLPLTLRVTRVACDSATQVLATARVGSGSET